MGDLASFGIPEPTTPIYRLLVTGSRTWPTDDTLLPDVLGCVRERWPCAVLVVGYDPVKQRPDGVDRRAHSIWWALGSTVECHPADWERYGRSAGFKRNQEMVDSGADLCLAFIYRGSKGATHCAGRARTAGIPVVAFRQPVTPTAEVTVTPSG